ncbi:hypothetical protein M378DRAFT_131634 [Amanita muscaria Koide BX008]|uniref:Uncharacterized protein n=1 Tax=Amanita muscaria (strain Koide BX008) TaxID=946122 RepID=A0A0C2WD74_AMAMK|nr:hypothetical protein M378DRAFT_131634 [Amanita muscaria Koide BX008]
MPSLDMTIPNEPRNESAPMIQSQWGADLPFDILSSIFLLCLDNSNHQFVVPHSFSLSDDPRTSFSRVCSRWRSAVLETPFLWNDIVLQLDFPNIIDLGQHVLSRAPGASLHLGARMSQFQNRAPTRPSLEHFINMIIIPRAHSLKTLELFVPFPFVKAVLALPYRVQFPTLEALSLRQASIGTIMSSSSDIGIAGSIPNMKTLELDLRWSNPLLEGSIGFPLDIIPWSQLTTFVNLNAMPAKKFVDILSFCPMLKSCGIRLERLREPPWFPQVTALALERLHIRFSYSVWIDRFLLWSLSLPSIRDLALKEAEVGLAWTDTISNFLTNQCGSQLESLYVASVRMCHAFVGPDGFFNFLVKHARTLKELYIPLFSGLHPLGLAALRWLLSGNLSPHLERLSLQAFYWPTSLDHLSTIVIGLRETIEYRRGVLRELHMFFYYDRQADHIERAVNATMQEFSKANIKIYIDVFNSNQIQGNLAVLEKNWFGYYV